MATPRLPKSQAHHWQRKSQGYSKKLAPGGQLPRTHMEKEKENKGADPQVTLGVVVVGDTPLSRKTQTWVDQRGGKGP